MVGACVVPGIALMVNLKAPSSDYLDFSKANNASFIAKFYLYLSLLFLALALAFFTIRASD